MSARHGLTNQALTDQALTDQALANEAMTHEALAEHRAHDRLLAGISLAALTLCRDGTILSANRRMGNLLRVSPGSVVGTKLAACTVSDDHALLGSLLALGSGRRYLRLQRADGLGVPVRLTLKPVDAAADAPLFALVYERSLQTRALTTLRVTQERLATAIEERERAERMLRDAQRMEAVGQLTAGIAHDFNNLLQTMMAQLELLQDRVGDDARAHTCIESALGAADRGAQLTHHLLAFSRKQMLQPRPVDIGQRMHAMAEMLRRTLGSGITIHTTEPEGLIGFADPVQLEACILHLAINARDAMPQGGELMLEGFDAQVDALGASETMPAGNYVVIAVQDTGTGMAAQVLARVFEPFFSTKPVGKGSGLGLSMVLGYARQSGGDVRIESEPGSGTRVEIFLPLTATGAADPAPAARETMAAGAEPGAGPAARILLVDEREEITETVAWHLQRAGFSVTRAASTPDALRIIAGPRPIDAVVTDGAMSGVELVRQAVRLRPGLRGLLVTDYLDIETLSQLPPGVAVLHKPFPRKTLIARLARLVGRRTVGDAKPELVATHATPG